VNKFLKRIPVSNIIEEELKRHPSDDEKIALLIDLLIDFGCSPELAHKIIFRKPVVLRWVYEIFS